MAVIEPFCPYPDILPWRSGDREDDLSAGVARVRGGGPNGVRTRVSTLRVFSGPISLPAALAGSGS